MSECIVSGEVSCGMVVCGVLNVVVYIEYVVC